MTQMKERANPQIAQLFSSPDRHELSMVFQFEHIMLDQEGSDKWNLKKLDFPDYDREELSEIAQHFLQKKK